MEEPDERQPEPVRVRCDGCGREVGEDEAQAQRWGYWFRIGELYPFCPACAEREFSSRR